MPNPPGAVAVTWSKISGPGTVALGNANAQTTTATFSAAGQHILLLSATDGASSTSDTVTITIKPATGPTLPPDLATVVPPLDPMIAATHQAGISFLYTGANPIQTGGVPGTINSVRGAAICGGALYRKASFLLEYARMSSSSSSSSLICCHAASGSTTALRVPASSTSYWYWNGGGLLR